MTIRLPSDVTNFKSDGRKGSLALLAIRADTACFERAMRKATDSVKRFEELAKKVRERRKPASVPDDLEAFLRTWKKQKRQQQAWEYPLEVERQMVEQMGDKRTLLAHAVFWGDGSA